MTAPRRKKRTGLPEDVAFPVTPFLDMAFQLLAFFILTFQAPSREARLDLYLPSAPVASPGPAKGNGPAAATTDLTGLDTDLPLKAEASETGRLTSLRLGEAPVKDAKDLEERLRRYIALLEGKPLRIRFTAPDRLLYDEAARIVGACEAAGVMSIRLGGER